MTDELREEDGAYYAVKGFAFQFDKTILSLLEADSDDQEIEIEVFNMTDPYLLSVRERQLVEFVAPAEINIKSTEEELMIAARFKMDFLCIRNATNR